MRNLNREWIAVGFDNDEINMIPVIKMSGTNGLKKEIKGICNVRQISIFHLNFNDRSARKVGIISWPENINKADVIISYRPETETGELQIRGTDMIWSYDMREQPDERKSGQAPAARPSEKGPVVDRNKVRELEEKEERMKILWPNELAEELKKDIKGQDEAVIKLSELIAANLRRKTPEAEVIVLFGTTGVGKTEIGKKLPEALTKLTGVEYELQQIALSEFIGEHTVNRFFGAPASYAGYKEPTIFEPARKNPYQVFLLDEIEKATDRIWTGLMEVFSTSTVRLADNSIIDLNHAVFIITSNIPIDMDAYNAASSFQKKEICRDALSKECGHPEIAGKITNCIAFQSLSRDALTDIVAKFVKEELDNYDMTLEHMDAELMVQLKQQQSSYGARGVRDAVREAINHITLYERNIGRYKGKRVILKGDVENIQIEIVPEAVNL